MKEWDKIQLEFERFDLVDKSEITWLKEQFSNVSLDEDIDWNNLSDSEKQLKRIFWSKMAKKTEGYDKGFFKYEECVIDLYESLTTCLNKINYSMKKDLQITRLKAFLYLTKRNINAYKDVRNVKYFYFERFTSLIRDCLNSGLEKYFIEDINLLYLESKLENLKRLKNNDL